MRGLYIGGVICTLFLNISQGSARAEESVDTIVEDVALYWSPVIEDPAVGEPSEISPEELDEVTPAQMLTPQRRPSMRVAQRARRTSSARSSSGLSNVPFMIGDTGAGSCVSFGTLLSVDLGHPTLGCSRLNISEGNTPLPTDRVFFSYRHFENATPTRVFQFEQAFDIDRYVLGAEKTFFNGLMSAELRLPIEGRLNSDLETYVVNADSTLFTPVDVFDVLRGEFSGNVRRTELANMSLIFKALLMERSDFALSAGVGFTLPTARDVTYATRIDEFVTFPDFPGLLARYSIALDATATNETFYVSPFLAWLWQPDPRWFHQGFMQVEVAANPSKVIAAGGGVSTFDTSGDGTPDPFDPNDTVLIWETPFPLGAADLQGQTLLRLNLGCGCILMENPQADFIQQLTALFEVHYTTTLNDANISSIPLLITGLGFSDLDSIDIGNRDNRIDIINLVAGVSANCGNLVITHGFAAPVKSVPDRGFDFEYNLQVQRPF